VVQIVERERDGDIIARLTRQAHLHGRSFEEELREVLRQDVPLSPEELVAIVRQVQAMTPDVPQTDSADIIRTFRDAR
jgi:plasmid stability protein